jgi:threonine/homoserine efflux transporter RhtA
MFSPGTSSRRSLPLPLMSLDPAVAALDGFLVLDQASVRANCSPY